MPTKWEHELNTETQTDSIRYSLSAGGHSDAMFGGAEGVVGVRCVALCAEFVLCVVLEAGSCLPADRPHPLTHSTSLHPT